MPELDDETRAEVARHLGMKPAEIAAVAPLDGAGAVVEDHTGYRVLIMADGALAPWVGPMPGHEDDDVPAGDEDADDGVDDDPTGGSSDDNDPDAVPDGSAEVVLGWVAEDRERAARALKAEQARDKPRSTLTAHLEKLAGLA